MKIAKGLLPFLLIILAVITVTGCSHTDKTDVEGVITNELDLLKNLDTDTTRKYVSYKELFPDATEDTELSKEVKEVFSLFFKDFNYKILTINVDKVIFQGVCSLDLPHFTVCSCIFQSDGTVTFYSIILILFQKFVQNKIAVFK